MEEDKKAIGSQEIDSGEEKLLNRRDFLDGLGKWSKIVIGAAVFGGALLSADEEAEARGAWANGGGRGGGGWANGGGRGGGAWANGGGGGGWANRAGGGGAWVNGGGGGTAWVNRGAAWANHGGSWINRY